ncbi:MAG: pilus assembly FimT family protein [Planctomycetota bacterium]
MKRTGFTLIELMVVLAIISLLIVAAIPGYRAFSRHRDRGTGAAVMLLRSHLEATRVYAITNNRRAGVFYIIEPNRTRYFMVCETAQRKAVKRPIYDPQTDAFLGFEEMAIYLWDTPMGHDSKGWDIDAELRLHNTERVKPRYHWRNYQDTFIATPALLGVMGSFPAEGIHGHIFSPEGTLDSRMPLKARIEIAAEDGYYEIEIVGTTGRVKILEG